MGKPERPLYCGNYEYEMEERDIRRMFEEWGDVDRIDMKTFCFVYMSDERDAERAIRKMDGLEVGRRNRPLRCQWAKTKDADRKRDTRPSDTLFVVNFDASRVRESDIERHFDSYGGIKRVEIKKGYAFVQFEKQEDAEYALKKTHLSNLLGRTITVSFKVEYVQNTNPTNGGGGGGDRGGYRDDYRRGGRDDYRRDDYRGGRGRDYDRGGRDRDRERSRDRDDRRGDSRRSPVGRSRSRSRSPARRGSPPGRSRSRSPARGSPARRGSASRSPAARKDDRSASRSPGRKSMSRSPDRRSRSKSRGRSESR